MTFEEACKELQISEDELEQLVANGEIAGIKEGDTFFFKKDVVAQYKKSRKTEPTIILADEDMEILNVMDEIDLTTPPEEPTKKTGEKAPAEDHAASAMNLLEGDDPTDLKVGEDEITIEPRAGKGKAGAAESPSPEDTVLNLEG